MASRPSLDKAAWQRTRAAVRRRDGNACVVCGATERLSVHHILAARAGGGDTMDNLVTLCRADHNAAETQLRRARPRPEPTGTLTEQEWQSLSERERVWRSGDLSPRRRHSREW
jgi:5-methylcytosine-specific restriction endonuclease McrA